MLRCCIRSIKVLDLERFHLFVMANLIIRYLDKIVHVKQVADLEMKIRNEILKQETAR